MEVKSEGASKAVEANFRLEPIKMTNCDAHGVTVFDHVSHSIVLQVLATGLTYLIGGEDATEPEKSILMVVELRLHVSDGITEHLNCTLLKWICAFTYKSGLPKSLWGKALRHAIWLKNQMAMCALNGKMPFEALYGRPPNLSTLHMWGTNIWVYHSAGFPIWDLGLDLGCVPCRQ
jgi:hypothetical protein